MQTLESELRELARLFNHEKVEQAVIKTCSTSNNLGLTPMSKDQTSQSRLVRSISVEMTSEAITRRLREASELNHLGLSLAKATRITPTSQPTLNENKQVNRSDK